MSQLLLYKSNEIASEADTYDIYNDETVSTLFRLNDFALHFSWFDNNNFKPYHENDRAYFFCTGILYFDGSRIDKKWEVIASRWHQNQTDDLHELNGYGNLLIFDRRVNRFTIITSRMGFQPLYGGKSNNGNKIAVGTHPDQVAEYLEMNTLDKLSIAEFIATSCISAPHTYYENIKQLKPASIYRFDGKDLTNIQTYWKPELEHEDFADTRESAKIIAGYIKESVNRRIAENNNKGLLLLSGGLDSRSVLFAPSNPPEMLEAVTFYNEPNTELRLSSQLAEKAGVEHHHLQREYDYYGKLAIDTIKLTGGMWNFACYHTSGFDEELRNLNKGILLSGMYFDTFFKGFAFDKKILHKKLTGSIYKGYPAQDIYWDARGANDIKKEWKEAIHQRRCDSYGYEAFPEEDLTPQVLNKIKYSRIGNMARIRSGGMDIALYRSQFYDMVVSDINFSRVFSFLNPYDEVKSDFMKLIIKNLTEKNLSVADSNVINSEFLFNNYYLTVSRNILMKRIRKVYPKSKNTSISIDSSWIDWYTYRRDSELINNLWKECEKNKMITNLMKEIMGYDPFSLKPDFSTSKYDFLNLLTVGLWLKYGYKS